MRRTVQKTAIPLGVVFLLGNLGGALYGAYGLQPSSAFRALYFAATAWAMAWWFVEDRRARGLAVSIDYGWFALWAWPLVLPYHLFRTRGWRGFAVIGKCIALFILTWLASLPLFYLLRR